MKKTLAALSIGAFAASASNAAIVYKNSEGTEVTVDGSIRVVMESKNTKRTATNQKRSHSGIRNAGSRFDLNINQDLGNDFYAYAHTQIRFAEDGTGTSGLPRDNKYDDNWGSLTVRRAYAGLGHKQYGQVGFGKQTTPADDVGIAKDYSYGILPDYIPDDGNQTVRYDYLGVEGLQLSASYTFAQDRDKDRTVLDKSRNNTVVLGGTYEGQVGEGKLLVGTAYGRVNYQDKNSDRSGHQDGYQLSLGYAFSGLTASIDSGYVNAKHILDQENAEGLKYDGDSKGFYVSPGLQYQVTPTNKVYTNYLYQQQKQTKTVLGASVDNKQKTHGVLVGVDHKFNKHALVYLEGKYLTNKKYTNGNYINNSKETDKAIGVGIRVYF